MKANTTTKNGECRSESRTVVSRAIDWLQSYIDEDPDTDAAKEARSIINGLEALRKHPALDQLLALIAQIAKTDRGLQEINRATIQMSQTEKKT
jgi:hypothetical protein